MTKPVPGPGDVELRAVHKRYGHIRAVDGLSLLIESGEFLTLLGPSGCGKSTTLKVVGGFEQPDSGEILLGGRPLGRTPPHLRPVNTVFQNYALFPHLSVEQNIAFGLRMARVAPAERRRRVDEATGLVRLNLGDQRKPSELSGGQQQRVALARALVNRPAVLLLDEPLGALDLALRTEMQRELRDLNRRLGTTFLYVTHDQNEALAMSDRIAVMQQGRILQVGAPAEIYERPRTRFVAEFIGQANVLPGKLAGYRDGVADVSVDGIGLLRATIPSGCEPARGSAVWVVVRPEHIEIDSTGGEATSVNRISGVVVESIYAGSHHRIVVEAPGGIRIGIHRPNAPGACQAIGSEQRVELSFSIVDASVVMD